MPTELTCDNIDCDREDRKFTLSEVFEVFDTYKEWEEACEVEENPDHVLCPDCALGYFGHLGEPSYLLQCEWCGDVFVGDKEPGDYASQYMGNEFEHWQVEELKICHECLTLELDKRQADYEKAGKHFDRHIYESLQLAGWIGVEAASEQLDFPNLAEWVKGCRLVGDGYEFIDETRADAPYGS